MGGGISALHSELSLPPDATDLPAATTAPLDEVRRYRQLFKLLADDIKKEEEHTLEVASRRDHGKVIIVYEQYTDTFDLQAGGTLAIAAVDEEYCLSDIMPGATFELSQISAQSRIDAQINGDNTTLFEEKNKEDESLWTNLYTYDDEPKKWYVLVFQDKAQRDADLKATKERMSAIQVEESSERVEGCSCLAGNPCSEANKYSCRNFKMRFAIAKENGWKGF